jgi:hypothetical protein
VAAPAADRAGKRGAPMKIATFNVNVNGIGSRLPHLLD